ncbi:MAG: hypothetical protein M5U22_01015 [Thermoleophilia bacterium]|nr:hypothetical protein [Thermoleophilia bacterium]
MLTRYLLPAIIVLAVSSFACSSATPPSSADPNPAPTAAQATAATGAGGSSPISLADAAALRKLAFAYWKAYNAYDVDAALAYLEPGYRAARAKVVSSEINRIETFGVTLGISEKSPPLLTGPDQGEMLLDMKEPLGTRTIRMGFVRVGDSWWISAAEESE